MQKTNLKFKVWDGKKICEVKNIEFAEDGVIITKDDGYFGYLDSDFQLLQYTGFKDKNGKEIYTGYILDCSYINPMTGDVVKKLYVVGPAKAYVKAQCIGGHPYDNFPLFLKDDRGVIIGNKYQNPELLEVK